MGPRVFVLFVTFLVALAIPTTRAARGLNADSIGNSPAKIPSGFEFRAERGLRISQPQAPSGVLRNPSSDSAKNPIVLRRILDEEDVDVAPAPEPEENPEDFGIQPGTTERLLKERKRHQDKDEHKDKDKHHHKEKKEGKHDKDDERMEDKDDHKDKEKHKEHKEGDRDEDEDEHMGMEHKKGGNDGDKDKHKHQDSDEGHVKDADSHGKKKHHKKENTDLVKDDEEFET